MSSSVFDRIVTVGLRIMAARSRHNFLVSASPNSKPMKAKPLGRLQRLIEHAITALYRFEAAISPTPNHVQQVLKIGQSSVPIEFSVKEPACWL